MVMLMMLMLVLVVVGKGSCSARDAVEAHAGIGSHRSCRLRVVVLRRNVAIRILHGIMSGLVVMMRIVRDWRSVKHIWRASASERWSSGYHHGCGCEVDGEE